MAKSLIWAAALIVSALILATGGLNAQREMVPIDEPAPSPAPEESSVTPVMVENFPTTQTVEVRNFPLIVTVEGTVDVGNLPLDAEGNVRVAGELGMGSSAAARFVGISAGTVEPNTTNVMGNNDVYGILDSNIACQADFSDTRICLWPEIAASIPAPQYDGCVVIARGLDGTEQGTCFNTNGRQSNDRLPALVACCGF